MSILQCEPTTRRDRGGRRQPVILSEVGKLCLQAVQGWIAVRVRFKRTVRLEWLDLHIFESIGGVQQSATEWRWS